MTYASQHLAQPPTREQADHLPGAAVLEFGTPWCGHCLRAQPLIEQALASRGDVAHLKVEDGPGQPLGRSYRVKLWPTLIFLQDGQEVARLVRPDDVQTIEQALLSLPLPAQP